MAISNFVDGLVRSIPHTGVQAAIAAMLFTGDYRLYGYYLAAYIVSTEVMSHVIKAIAVRTLPRRFTRRPTDYGKGACGHSTKGVCSSCSVYASPGTRSRTPGMYSGHSASVFFNLVFWSMYMFQTGVPKRRRMAFSGLLLAAAVAVAHNRVAVGCHSVLQVSVGAVVGSLMALASYKFLNRMEGDTFPMNFDNRDMFAAE